MEIERLLKISKEESDKEVIKMILSNRITHYLNDHDGAAIAMREFDTIADDILKFIENRKQGIL